MLRASKLATAALVLAAQLLAVAHVASVRHASIPALDTVCRAHEHTSESLHEGVYVGTHADERCAAVAHLSTFAKLSAAPSTALVACTSQVTSSELARAHHPPQAPLSLAPKSSPPVVG